MRPGTAYCCPILLLWFSTTVLTVAMTEVSMGFGVAIALVFIATPILFPGMHHRLKAFQHGYATYGDRRFAFASALRKFYWIYVKGLGVMALGSLAGAAVVTISVFILRDLEQKTELPRLAWLLGAIASGVTVYVFAWPYWRRGCSRSSGRTRIAVTWSFRTEIKAWPLFRLVLRNVALTLITCGLYWPFASIALARYRIECMRVDAYAPWRRCRPARMRAPVAVGDAAADTSDSTSGYDQRDFPAIRFDGRTALAQEVDVRLEGASSRSYARGAISLERVRLDPARVSERFAAAPRIVALDDGASLEIADPDGSVDRAFEAAGVRRPPCSGCSVLADGAVRARGGDRPHDLRVYCTACRLPRIGSRCACRPASNSGWETKYCGSSIIAFQADRVAGGSPGGHHAPLR